MINPLSLSSSLFAVMLLLAGCSDQRETPAAQVSPLGETSTPVQPLPSDPGLSPVRDAPGQTQAAQPETSTPTAVAPVEGKVHPFMTAQLRIFVRDQRRMPKDFSEFATARMDSVPFAPAGMRYVIDPATTEVKIVKE